ncbi:MAG: hypothetical protein GY777_31490 [Candidatus Brocadiaceae bacterium]|nr:hypothetical protein [Candidatus Brocadiaceae bacterium]
MFSKKTVHRKEIIISHKAAESTKKIKKIEHCTNEKEISSPHPPNKLADKKYAKKNKKIKHKFQPRIYTDQTLKKKEL